MVLWVLVVTIRQLKFHLIRQEQSCIAAIPYYISHQGRGYGGVFRRAGKEYGFHIRCQHAVHVSYCFFVFKVGYVAYAAQNVFCLHFMAVVYRKPLIAGHLNAAVVAEYLANPSRTLLYGEHWLLGRVDTDANDQLIEHGYRPAHYVHMPLRYRVKRSGKKANAFHIIPLVA